MPTPPVHVLAGSPPIPITLRRHARARRFSLRVGAADGQVTLTLPPRAAVAEAMAFARSHEAWLRQALARLAPPVAAVGLGARVPVEGRMLVLTPATGRIRIEEDRLLVPGLPETAGARVQAWLKVLARNRLAAACDHYAGQLGRPYTRLTLRDTRSRWGSCSADGALMFSWRLVMAPPDVLAYVAAHEVAHLAEMNHSPAFWAVVARLFPDWQPRRAWLRKQGGSLQGLRFTA